MTGLAEGKASQPAVRAVRAVLEVLEVLAAEMWRAGVVEEQARGKEKEKVEEHSVCHSVVVAPAGPAWSDPGDSAGA